MSITTCSPAQAHQRGVGGGVQLVDVRTPAEFRAVHAEGALLRPLDRFDAAAIAAGVPAGATIHLMCKSGGRARQAAQKLAEVGCACVVVDGGTDAWAGAGLPVVRGKGVMSLERQVRIAAGLLVLSGVVLGFTVHPYWFGLSGCIGAGLAFAGLTDTCMMGMAIAKLPWNR
ncbi:MAG: rhodanese-like domain-containing protein [Planctomycetes bacterium]|nr:rhodanese-like domain-containing protein [Planctomycetota bacterium]